MMIRFFIYGLLGWSLEIFWTGLGSFSRGEWRLMGYTYLWMLPIYGLAVFLEPVHDYIRHWSWIVRGLVWVVAIFAVEYTAGWVLKILTGSVPWDYTWATRYSVNGFIRLDYAPVWFITGLVFERVHDFLRQRLPG